MKAFIFQHVPFESPAAILNWLHEKAFEVNYIRFFEDASLPPVREVDWLIIMGGPMSVNDEKEFPWLISEKRFIKECIDSGKVVVGVCLGAQLIASSSGSKVYQGKYKEIGWFPVQPVKAVYTPDNLIPSDTVVFHWHGETFDLPQGARLLASTDVCTHQIFMIGNHVLGMQCHLEMTTEAIEGMLKYCSDEINPAPYIQTAAQIREGAIHSASNANHILFSLLNSLEKRC